VQGGEDGVATGDHDTHTHEELGENEQSSSYDGAEQRLVYAVLIANARV
jgi:hypothetical protein